MLDREAEQEAVRKAHRDAAEMITLKHEPVNNTVTLFGITFMLTKDFKDTKDRLLQLKKQQHVLRSLLSDARYQLDSADNLIEKYKGSTHRAMTYIRFMLEEMKFLSQYIAIRSRSTGRLEPNTPEAFNNLMTEARSMAANVLGFTDSKDLSNLEQGMTLEAMNASVRSYKRSAKIPFSNNDYDNQYKFDKSDNVSG